MVQRTISLFLVAIFMVHLLCLTPAMALADAPRGSIVFTRDQQLNLGPGGGAGSRPDLPRELRRKYRGCKAGGRRRLKKLRYRLFLPSIVMGNV